MEEEKRKENSLQNSEEDSKLNDPPSERRQRTDQIQQYLQDAMQNKPLQAHTFLNTRYYASLLSSFDQFDFPLSDWTVYAKDKQQGGQQRGRMVWKVSVGAISHAIAKIQLFSLADLTRMVKWFPTEQLLNMQIHDANKGPPKNIQKNYAWQLVWKRDEWRKWMRHEWREINHMTQLGILLRNNLNPHLVWMYHHWIGFMHPQTWARWKGSSTLHTKWHIPTLGLPPFSAASAQPRTKSAFSTQFSGNLQSISSPNLSSLREDKFSGNPSAENKTATLPQGIDPASAKMVGQAIGKCIVQECEMRTTLEDILMKQSLSPREILSCMYQIISGLIGSHVYTGLAHMDLYGRNVFCCKGEYDVLRYQWNMTFENCKVFESEMTHKTQQKAETEQKPDLNECDMKDSCADQTMKNMKTFDHVALNISIPSDKKRLWVIGDWGNAANKHNDPLYYWFGSNRHSFEQVKHEDCTRWLHVSEYKDLHPLKRDILAFLTSFMRVPLSINKEWIKRIMMHCIEWPFTMPTMVRPEDQKGYQIAPDYQDQTAAWIKQVVLPDVHTWFTQESLHAFGMDMDFLSSERVQSGSEDVSKDATRAKPPKGKRKPLALSPVYDMNRDTIREKFEKEATTLYQWSYAEIEEWSDAIRDQYHIVEIL